MFRYIQQYHLEFGVGIGAVTVLGVHNPAKDNWKVTEKTYQSQWYENGTM